MNPYSKFLSSRTTASRKGHLNYQSQRITDPKLLVAETPLQEVAKGALDLIKFQTEKKDQKAKPDANNYGFNLTSKVNKVSGFPEFKPDFSGNKTKAVAKKVLNLDRPRARDLEGELARFGHPPKAQQISSATALKIDEFSETPKGNGVAKGSQLKLLQGAPKKLFVFQNRAGREAGVEGLVKGDSSLTNSLTHMKNRQADDAHPKDEYGGHKDSGRKDSLPYNALGKLLLGKHMSSGAKSKTGSEPRKLAQQPSSDESKAKFLTSRGLMSPNRPDAAPAFTRSREGSSSSGYKELEFSNRVFGFLKEEKFELLVEFLQNLRASDPSINWQTVINSKEPVSERTLVHYALIYQRLDLLVYLIESRADFHLRDKEGVIPLMIAASESWPAALDLVIENTHDVNIQDRCGNTALHVAVAKSNIDFIERLLMCRNVNVRQTNAEGMKPLDLAEVHLVVRMQSIFRKYELMRGEYPGLSNSNRISQILARGEGRTPKESTKKEGRKIYMGGRTEGATSGSKDCAISKFHKKVEVPSLHLNQVERSFEQEGDAGREGRVQYVDADPSSPEYTVDPKLASPILDILEDKNEDRSLERQGSVDHPDSSPKHRHIFLNPNHTIAGVRGHPGRTKPEQKSMVFGHKNELRNMFVKKRSEKSIHPRFGTGLKPREGRSQAPGIPPERKTSLSKLLPRKPVAHLTLENCPPEACDQIDIEVLNGKVKKDETKTFIKRAHTGTGEDVTPSEPLSTPVRKPSLNDFIIHSIIGKGSFGEVYLVQKKGTKRFYAMKTLPKRRILKENLTRYALTERNVLSTISHPFIVKLRYAFQNTKTLFLIMDYLPGGDLGRYLQDEGQISEAKARIYAAEIVLAISELHKRDIIFRDLKPENVLLDKDGHAMLSDFGLSKEGVMAENQERSFCGSVAYLAPEMLKKTGHGKAMDWYLVGVIIYEMVVGIPPFFAETKEELFSNIEHATVRFPSALSASLKDLLARLFEKDPTQRIKEDDIKGHPWFKDVNWEAALQRKLRPPRPFIKKMKMNQLGDIIPDIENENLGIENLKGWTFIEEIGDVDPRLRDRDSVSGNTR